MVRGLLRNLLMMNEPLKAAVLLGCVGLCGRTAELRIQPEFLRTTPTGEVVGQDRAASGHAPAVFAGARAGYISFQVIAELRAPGEYSLEWKAPAGLQVELFREWYHSLEKGNSYVPDALAPIRPPYRSLLPEPDNRISGQKAHGFWVDVWIPGNARPGEYAFELRLSSSEGPARISVPMRVLPASVPSEDAVTIDHNSYGSSWIGDLYPQARAAASGDFYRSDGFFKLIHAYHRLFYEHRGIFHQLGYGHGGKVGPEFAPALEGSGRNRHIASWELFDRHYGPLFDGSAFAGSRRGAKPVPFVYLPINPEWPASYLWWGEPGYETEFVNVVSAMERHFREKNWTRTRMELFFNHKKRYMGFPWDGDEERFPGDLPYFREYGRLLRKAVPPDSPVKFVFRADVSWDMERQAKELAGIVNMWICGDGILSWYPEVARSMKQRGDIVWFYSGPPEVTQPAGKITEFPLQAWLWGIDGYVHWLTVSPGADPWFRYDGGGTALAYSGERFGIEGPIPSIRLKIQRNALQDLALLVSFQTRQPAAELRTEAASRFNGSRPEDWWNPRPALADRPPYEWTNGQIDEASSATRRMLQKTAADSWENVHEFVMQLAGAAK
jgi:hypothetical protein